MLGIGIIGTGSIADVYVANAARMKNYRIVAVAARDVDRAKARAAGWGTEGLGVEALLARDDIDVVLNLTPPAAHHATTRAALAAGKHVFSEKPLGASLGEALDLMSFADERNLRLGAAPDSILGAGIQKARALIDGGGIGRPLLASGAILYHGADGWHPNPSFFYRPGGGPAHDVGPYYLAALVSLLGPIEAVRARAFKGFATRTITATGPEQGMAVPVDIPTSALALLSFASGVEATLVTSWDVWATRQPNIEIHGTEGSLGLPHPNFHGGPLAMAVAAGGFRDVPLDEAPLAEPNWPPSAPVNSNYRGIGLAEMIDAIVEGRPHRCSALLAAHVVEAADAMLASAATDATVRLSLKPERPAPFTPNDAARLMRPTSKDA